MTQQTLAFNKLITRSYINIFDELNKRANVNDPKRTGNARNFIYDYDPFHHSINFEDMPYLILELPQLNYPKMSSDGKRKMIRFTHRLTVRTARKGSGQAGNLDTGRRDMMDITDDLHQMFNSDSVREVLRGLNIYMTNLTEISTDTLSVDGKYVYENIYELSYHTPWLNINS